MELWSFGSFLEDNSFYDSVKNLGVLMDSSTWIPHIPETLLKSTIYNPLEESYIVSTDELRRTDDYVPIPKPILPISSSYKIDVYWWGLRGVDNARKGVELQIDDLIIKSNIITDKRSNCNFPNGRASEILEMPLDEDYSPMLNIRLFYNNSFGRTHYLSTNISKSPNKYKVRWLPKSERDGSLKCAHISSAEFIQMSQALFVKRSSETVNNNTCKESCSCDFNTFPCKRRKKFEWVNLFWQRELHEEEYSLLPLFLTTTRIDNALSHDRIEKDWWLKYNFRREMTRCSYSDEIIHYDDRVILYDSELENRPEFSKLKDWCTTLKLYNGKKTGIPENDAKLYCGLLKAGFAIYRWPPTDDETPVTLSGIKLYRGFFDDHPINDSANFLIRVYIVRGIHFNRKIFAGKSNPYVKLTCGSQDLGEWKNCIPKTFNPIFGLMFDLRCCLPEDYLLAVSLYNYDANSKDELIGCTTIDLENRIYSRHRARVGLASKYKRNDLYEWRDCLKPSAILKKVCLENHLPSPFFLDSTTLVLNGVEYKDNKGGIDSKENLCLSILQNWHTMPICGHHLVPEHVETRTLYHQDSPGVEQGKIQMWVDIFPLDTNVNIPPPIDITPKKTQDYELRVTIRSVQFIDTKDNMSKIHRRENLGREFADNVYIRIWLGFKELMQSTDIDYNRSAGEAIFNCRMIFQFIYQPSTGEITCIDKRMFNNFNEYALPILNVQLIENDSLPPNDVLGSLTFELNKLSPESQVVDERIKNKDSSMVNLFLAHTHRAWWPLIDNCKKQNYPIGKVDLELTLIRRNEGDITTSSPGRHASFTLIKSQRPGKTSDTFICKIKKFFGEKKQFTLIWVILLSLVVGLIIFLTVYFELPAIILEYLFYK